MPPNALKQRLAALSASIPRHTANDASPQSPTQSTASKARAFFRPLPRRASDASSTNSEEYIPQMQNQEKLQEVLSRMVFQAGVDYESVVMLVLLRNVTNIVYIQNSTYVRIAVCQYSDIQLNAWIVKGHHECICSSRSSGGVLRSTTFVSYCFKECQYIIFTCSKTYTLIS